MAAWKLLVENYGKIKRAEIEIAPLTLFVGDNNSGKSFLLSLLWGIENLGAETILRHSYDKTEELDMLFSWLSKQLDAAIGSGTYSVPVIEIKEPLERFFNKQLEKNKNNLVKAIFNSKQVSIGKIAIEFCGVDSILLNFKITGSGDMKMFTDSCFVEYGIGNDVLREKSWQKDTGVLYFLLEGIYCLMDITAGGMVGGDIYLPAARTGFMLTKDIINKVGRKNTFNISDSRETITPFARPVNHFF